MNEQINFQPVIHAQKKTSQANVQSFDTVGSGEEKTLFQKFFSYVKNPFTLALTTWVVIAILFLIEIFAK
jgi:hypothetical protein